MLKQVLLANALKFFMKNDFRFFHAGINLSDSQKSDKPCEEKKLEVQSDKLNKVEAVDRKADCDQGPEKTKAKSETREYKEPESLKICVKDTCLEADPPLASESTKPCHEVVCEKEKKSEEPKPLEDISVEPLVACNFDDCKVVIIGAGLAGLAAAKYLQENQITNYVILEAQSRPGGRIHSEWFSDTVVELGASSPKSSNDSTPFVQSAMADGFIKPPFAYMSIFKTSDGHTITPTISLIAYEIYKKIHCESTELETNPLEYINFRIEQEVSNFPYNVQQDVARVLLGILAMQYKKEGDNLAQFIRQDMHINYLQSPSGMLRVPLGHYGIVQPMMDRIPKENIKFNKPVQNIRWGAVVCKDTPRALVKCCDGSVYPADYVVITVSLGVLKENHDILFCPALPADKVEAIESMGYANVTKMYFKYTEPFWSWCPNSINMKFYPEDRMARNDWTRGITAIHQIPGSNDVLHVAVAGDEATTVEKLSNGTILEGISEIIGQGMKIKSFPAVKSSLKSKWSSNVHFKGSYSCLPIGVADGIQQKLSNPLPGNNAPVSPILFFAGEATCPKLSGTVQAAKISGIREAARIKKIITCTNTQTSDEEKLLVSM